MKPIKWLFIYLLIMLICAILVKNGVAKLKQEGVFDLGELIYFVGFLRIVYALEGINEKLESKERKKENE